MKALDLDTLIGNLKITRKYVGICYKHDCIRVILPPKGEWTIFQLSNCQTYRF